MDRRARLAVAAALLGAAARARADGYVPPPPETVSGYSAALLPCRIEHEDRMVVRCKTDVLEHKSLRELSILRNTIYARYGWDGYRKPWLREYFHAQKWFTPNPKFTYKLLTDADRKNAHFIAAREQSLTDVELRRMRDDIYARYGKTWDDLPEWGLKNGKRVKSCTQPRDAIDLYEWDIDELNACHYAKQPWYKPDPKFSEDKISADDKIELGLLARAMGSFALDEDARGKREESLDRVLLVAELRQLSLRDLRLLRNTIYARRGRPFKSQILRDHFAGMSWYHVDNGFSDRLLTANDQRNIALIRSVENELGGPLTDEDWLTEPATDGA
jgi:hypothetical protein